MMADFTTQVNGAISHFRGELENFRTGRANPALIEDLPVLCYGTTTPLQQLASISVPEPQLLVVQPWDPSIIKDIEKGIQLSGLGITPVVDGKLIRLPFPPMTEERRRELLKVAQEKAEQARIRIRGHREEAIKQLRLKEKDGSLSEDQLAAEQKEIQAAVDKSQTTIDGLIKNKTDELMTI